MAERRRAAVADRRRVADQQHPQLLQRDAVQRDRLEHVAQRAGKRPAGRSRQAGRGNPRRHRSKQRLLRSARVPRRHRRALRHGRVQPPARAGRRVVGSRRVPAVPPPAADGPAVPVRGFQSHQSPAFHEPWREQQQHERLQHVSQRRRVGARSERLRGHHRDPGRERTPGAIRTAIGLVGHMRAVRLRACAVPATQAGLSAAALLVSVLSWTGGASAAQPASIAYTRDIRPLFRQHCYECHGADRSRAQLRLDRKDRALIGGVSGTVIKPGNSDESRLVRRLLGLDGVPSMPRGRDPLAPADIARIRAWIDQGSAWPDDVAADTVTAAGHWAYLAPVPMPPPTVDRPGWLRNAIDNFVLARLEKEGLAPSSEAARETLIRRLYLDLIGLPPSVAEVDAFVADAGDRAYERVVDRLLASPHYGERWARPWLDLARYADSNGYEKDRLRVMWRYRDWVIK